MLLDILLTLNIRMYLQQMKSLTENNPKNVYHLFSSYGYFTMRRKDNYFSDIVIEQDLVRLFKLLGGMTRGSGIDDSTFVNVMSHSSFLEDFTGVMKSSSEQHKDLRPSTMETDISQGKII